MMIAHKGLRSFNICIWDAICVPFCVFNNKINGKFISTDINGRSLDAISKSGWYTGANISELTSVFGDYFFKLFALVQHNNSKSIHGISSNGDVFDIYQTSSGTYNIYQTALKSDLLKINVSRSTDYTSMQWYINDTDFYEYIFTAIEVVYRKNIGGVETVIWRK